MAGSFESYADGIPLDLLQRLASVIKIQNSFHCKKSKLISILKENLTNGKVKFEIFSTRRQSWYYNFDHLMQILRHFEDLLNLTHDISNELTELWKTSQKLFN